MFSLTIMQNAPQHLQNSVLHVKSLSGDRHLEVSLMFSPTICFVNKTLSKNFFKGKLGSGRLNTYRNFLSLSLVTFCRRSEQRVASRFLFNIRIHSRLLATSSFRCCLGRISYLIIKFYYCYVCLYVLLLNSN